MAETAADVQDLLPTGKARCASSEPFAPSGEADASKAPAAGAQDVMKGNAFTELMAPKPAKQAKPPTVRRRPHPPNWKAGLLPYILAPTSPPQKASVLRVTEHTVLVKDAFPKATVHLLLLPRSPEHYNLHPFDAFAEDKLPFLQTMLAEASSAADLAASELARMLGPSSQLTLPANSSKKTTTATTNPMDLVRPHMRVGVHAHPSMSHLHVHVLSPDMRSPYLRHARHYNSFGTPFFVPLVDFPLGHGDPRRRARVQNANLKRDLACWRCGRAFGHRFVQLKAHLEEEWEAWMAEW